MESRNPFQQGLPAGFLSSSFVENMEVPAPECNLRLLAGTAARHSEDPESPAAGGSRRESESRPGPSGGGVADLFPELHRVLTRVSLTGVFDMNVEVWKILRYDEYKTRCRACECGGKHARFQPVCVDVTEDLRPDHLVLSCTGTEFGSSGEESD
ncbi:early E1B 16.8 kDa protein [Human mastadenovirus E]|uniref:Early E1B 16.8 kDa protein n=2 Tax=Human mastadenovirus E TaxID=130308 RepID=Q5GFC5_ADE04|nr:early E1B 16.8 kDa protein [Human adenovirus E4]AAT97482.1 early E1B 16.8 kDa protein [Human adenovirus E4]AVQ69357.1 early E1B 16.8 kDa protein [Human mastadenovirus E]QOX73555.1 early E1B 16.8 kDa protein [Human adenovirus E4]